MEPHELLGVAADADLDTIDRAWKRRLMDCHPDRHPHASPRERDTLADRTAALNQAHDLLVELVALRLAAPSLPTAPSHPTPPRAPHPQGRSTTRPSFGADRCEECGAVPADQFSFRSSGWTRYTITSGRLCRDCAVRIGQSVQVTSIFTYRPFPFRRTRDLLDNARGLRRAARLATPTGRHATVATANPGRYHVALAFHALRSVLLVAALIVFVVSVAGGGTRIPAGGTPAELRDAARIVPAIEPGTPVVATYEHLFVVGDCVDPSSGSARLVDCTDTSYVVLHLVANTTDCAGADALLIYNQPQPACARRR